MNRLKILVPLDNSENSQRTEKVLMGLKEKINGPLVVLHVYDPERLAYKGVTVSDYSLFEEQARRASEQFLEERVAYLSSHGLQVEGMFRTGSPRKVICELADSGEYDFVIIGRHAEGEVRSLLFGNVSNFVIHSVKCPVLVV